MDDFLEMTAIRRKHGAFNLLYYLCWAVVVMFGIAALFSLSSVIGVNPETGGMLFRYQSLIMFVAFGAVAFFTFRMKDNCRVEYDYTFTNGIFDISKVMDNRRRRYLCSLEMKEVIRCGPAAGPAFAKTLAEPNVKRHNWFVNREAKLYFFYFQKKGVKHVMIVELNDEMIAVIRSKKYLPMGAWYDADGTQKYASISR